MSKNNKYVYLWVVQGDYGFGWEDLTQDESRKIARGDLRAYRENSPGYPHRLIHRREPNPDYQLEAYFERFTIAMTLDDALNASHPGPCDAEVRELAERLAEQLDKIDPDLIRDELTEYGAWDELELSDDQANRERIVWIAAGNIREE